MIVTTLISAKSRWFHAIRNCDNAIVLSWLLFQLSHLMSRKSTSRKTSHLTPSAQRLQPISPPNQDFGSRRHPHRLDPPVRQHTISAFLTCLPSLIFLAPCAYPDRLFLRSALSGKAACCFTWTGTFLAGLRCVTSPRRRVDAVHLFRIRLCQRRFRRHASLISVNDFLPRECPCTQQGCCLPPENSLSEAWKLERRAAKSVRALVWFGLVLFLR